MVRLLIAVLVYCILCGAFIWVNPGLQYDESLLVLGAVHMRHSPSTELSLPHDPDTWLCWKGRCLELMTVRYVGAVKEYLCLPLFALFGPSAEIVRGVSVFMGAIGVFGIGYLLGWPVAAALAIHPAYVDLTVYDNGTVAVFMASIGLVCIAAKRYGAGFALGLAIGFGVWGRSNFLWFVFALCVAAVVSRVKVQWIRMALGAVLGAFPWLLYQVISKGGTFEAAGMFTVSEPWSALLWNRLGMLAETLISDREHRFIWGGPGDLPAWISWPALLLVLFACGYCLRKKGMPRAIAIVFLVLGAMYFGTRLPVAEHHLLALVPMAVAMVCYLPYRAVIGVAFLACALYWNAVALKGIYETGGVGQWSDGIYSLVPYLEENARGQEVRFLDWGLQNSVYVLSDGRVKSREVFSGSAISEGGVFVFGAPGNRFFPEATDAFLKELNGRGKRAKIADFAEIVILPRAVPSGTPDETSKPSGE